MKYVSLRQAPHFALMCAFLVCSGSAQARIIFFKRSLPNLISISDRPTIPAPATPPAEPPQTMPPSIPSNIATAIAGGRLSGNVTIGSMADINGLLSETVSQLPIYGPDMANAMGGIVADSPGQASRFEEGARLALAVAETLLAASRSSALEPEKRTNDFAFADTETPWSWKNEFPQSGLTPLEDNGVWIASNAKKVPVRNPKNLISTATTWADLDEKTLEYTYALQFAGYGIIHKDGHIFASWAIGHAIRSSNRLNNAVIDELQALSRSPKAKDRDDKIRFLLGYLKNPTLKRLNRWLAELGQALLGQAEAT